MDNIIPKVENNSVMKYIIKSFIDETYSFEKKSTRKCRMVFPKNLGGGGKFLPWSPPFEIFPEGATPYLHSPIAKP
jgi:hypothetical protein